MAAEGIVGLELGCPFQPRRPEQLFARQLRAHYSSVLTVHSSGNSTRSKRRRK